MKIAKKALNIKKDIVLINKQGILSPAIYGITDTKIFLDEESIKNKSDVEIKYTLMHELAHYKGKDLIINVILNILRTIYWFKIHFYILFLKELDKILN